MPANGTLKVWFDFLCPWARIGSHWIQNVRTAGALDLDIEWKAFSLEEVNLAEDASADELWSTAPDRRGLLPHAAAKWAETQGEEVYEKVHNTFFDARHVDKEKIGRPEVTEKLLSSAGVDGAAVTRELIENPKWLEAARSDHEEAAELKVFGVPTFVFPGSQPAFVRLLEITEGERAVELYERIRGAVTDPLVHEIKRPPAW